MLHQLSPFATACECYAIEAGNEVVFPHAAILPTREKADQSSKDMEESVSPGDSGITVDQENGQGYMVNIGVRQTGTAPTVFIPSRIVARLGC